jgi:hypothetical protein
MEKMVISKVYGPAHTLEEKSETLLATINEPAIKNDPLYVLKTIRNVIEFYTDKDRLVPGYLFEIMRDKMKEFMEYYMS